MTIVNPNPCTRDVTNIIDRSFLHWCDAIFAFIYYLLYSMKLHNRCIPLYLIVHLSAAFHPTPHILLELYEIK